MLHLSGITKTYANDGYGIEILHGITLEVADGEFVAIMGPSGSGKSTLMNILGILDVPTSGTYLFNDVDVSSCSDNERAGLRNTQIGFVFQMYNLLPRTTALANVELPLVYQGMSRSDRRRHATDALTKVGLGGKLNSMPNQLSGGQQQRVAIARALVVNPSLLLTDEPTGALDSKTSGEVLQIFRELNTLGQTIVMITHEHDVAAYAQRTIHIRDGRIEQ